jgi:hypothetical protein
MLNCIDCENSFANSYDAYQNPEHPCYNCLIEHPWAVVQESCLHGAYYTVQGCGDVWLQNTQCRFKTRREAADWVNQADLPGGYLSDGDDYIIIPAE